MIDFETIKLFLSLFTGGVLVAIINGYSRWKIKRITIEHLDSMSLKNEVNNLKESFAKLQKEMFELIKENGLLKIEVEKLNTQVQQLKQYEDQHNRIIYLKKVLSDYYEHKDEQKLTDELEKLLFDDTGDRSAH